MENDKFCKSDLITGRNPCKMDMKGYIKVDKGLWSTSIEQELNGCERKSEIYPKDFESKIIGSCTIEELEELDNEFYNAFLYSRPLLRQAGQTFAEENLNVSNWI